MRQTPTDTHSGVLYEARDRERTEIWLRHFSNIKRQTDCGRPDRKR